MRFLSSFLSCCDSRSNKTQSHAEKEVRRARVVRCYDCSNTFILRDHADNSTSYAIPPPQYSEIPHDDSRLAQFIAENEKLQPLNEELTTPQQPLPIVYPLQIQTTIIPAHTASDQSSIISIPSTRLSGLTSTYTGATNRTRIMRDHSGVIGENDSAHWRYSMNGSVEENSPPPSYYAGSDDGEGQRRGEEENDNDTAALHPVLTDGWLERLTVDAVRRLRDEERQRGNGRG